MSGRWGSLRSRRSYVIRVRKDQVLRVRASAGTSVAIADANGHDVTGGSDASCNSVKAVARTSAGDYFVGLSPCPKYDPFIKPFRVTFSAMR